MKNIVLKISMWVCILTLTGCQECGGDYQTINVVNNSSKTLGFYFDVNSDVPKYNIFKDTLSAIILEPYSKKETSNEWTSILSENKYHYIYFYDRAVLDSVPWDSIRTNNLYAKRIYFTLKTLDSLHWTLTYP